MLRVICIIKTFRKSENLLQGIVHLSTILHEETDNHILAVTVWAIGQIGKHTSEHAKAVAIANILPKLLEVHYKSFFCNHHSALNCSTLGF